MTEIYIARGTDHCNSCYGRRILPNSFDEGALYIQVEDLDQFLVQGLGDCDLPDEHLKMGIR